MDFETELNELVDKYLGILGVDRRSLARTLDETANRVRDEDGEE